MHTLQGVTELEIATSDNEDSRLVLIQIQAGLTKEAALASPAIHIVQRRQGYGTMLKLIAFLIKAFQDSLKVKEQMSSIDIIEAADLILETYTHDSVKDIILAFKEAKRSGKKFYNSLSQADLFDVLREYFDKKALWLESRHKDQKAGAESNSIAFLEGMAQHSPKQMEQMSNMIDPAHVNREHLRLRLTIQKQRQKRGL